MVDGAGFDLLFEEGPCLVVCKPGGILTQAPPGIDSLEKRIKSFVKSRDGKTGNVYLGVPHRLDRPVSGVMVFARHVRAARRLAEQFQTRVVRKIYLARVNGNVEPELGTCIDFVRKVPHEARAEVVDSEHAEGRKAVLHYRVLRRTDDESWLQIELETGRTHQIRVQMSSRGHPVVGDFPYGALQGFGPEVENERDRLISLHAAYLRFRHPMTRDVVEARAPLPDYWDTPEIELQL